jgi:hypothetical protein
VLALYIHTLEQAVVLLWLGITRLRLVSGVGGRAVVLASEWTWLTPATRGFTWLCSRVALALLAWLVLFGLLWFLGLLGRTSKATAWSTKAAIAVATWAERITANWFGCSFPASWRRWGRSVGRTATRIATRGAATRGASRRTTRRTECISTTKRGLTQLLTTIIRKRTIITVTVF